MRFIFGVVVGMMLMVGIAFVADTIGGAPGPDGRERRRMVDWAVVGDNVGSLSTAAQDLWARLVGDAKKLDKSVKE